MIRKGVSNMIERHGLVPVNPSGEDCRYFLEGLVLGLGNFVVSEDPEAPQEHTKWQEGVVSHQSPP